MDSSVYVMKFKNKLVANSDFQNAPVLKINYVRVLNLLKITLKTIFYMFLASGYNSKKKFVIKITIMI